jgi:hypothetical protein
MGGVQPQKLRLHHPKIRCEDFAMLGTRLKLSRKACRPEKICENFWGAYQGGFFLSSRVISK